MHEKKAVDLYVERSPRLSQSSLPTSISCSVSRSCCLSTVIIWCNFKQPCRLQLLWENLAWLGQSSLPTLWWVGRVAPAPSAPENSLHQFADGDYMTRCREKNTCTHSVYISFHYEWCIRISLATQSCDFHWDSNQEWWSQLKIQERGTSWLTCTQTSSGSFLLAIPASVNIMSTQQAHYQSSISSFTPEYWVLPAFRANTHIAVVRYKKISWLFALPDLYEM